MKAISLWQPWATLIALGEKRVETRGRRISHRGLVAIHAAQRWTADQAELLDLEPFKSRLAYHGISRANAVHWNMPRGAIVAVAEIVADIETEILLTDRWLTIGEGGFVPGVEERHFGNYAHGRRGYLLVNIRPLIRPVLCRGFQAMPFDVPPDVARCVEMEIDPNWTR